MPVERASVLILAGGRSRRLGQDKVWLMLDGQPLVERVARRVLPIADEIIFSTMAPDRFADLARSLPVPVQIVPDQQPGRGPLEGIRAGLAIARCELVLALATDLPFVSLPLLAHMVEIAAGLDAVVPQIHHRHSGVLALEPLHALYRRSCLPAIAARLAVGDNVAYSFLDDVRARHLCPEEIQAFDPDFLSFFNVNSPDDWREALRLASVTRDRCANG
jgi:molybdopterin-guanine dinucleotide biosynthesis protein A